MSTLPPRITVEERIRRYVAAMPAAISGSGGHDALFNVVRALIHGFGLTPEEARSFVEDYNQRCDPPWSEGEISHKLRSVDGLTAKWARGYGTYSRLERPGRNFPPASAWPRLRMAVRRLSRLRSET